MFVLFSYEVEEDDQSQYTSAVDKEDYKNAVRLQVAITAATQNDVVGKVMSKLNKAIEEGRFEDATFLRDNTGAGLVILKRRVAMTRAQGNISGAIEKLNQYLEIFMADHDAWRELVEIYVSLQM
ncbi:hypothetical protein POM88_035979 [Heracleum sosnowskyi]|uniref:EMC2 TPR-like domain-containing protein n=1 Tax=Heracleum sosnowskyi TaxID=360622 RepID=A0AAD8MEG5_9APIA|nr:hypothetical protein POM88_035979 [Heracleum sosnowskyi]